MLVWPIGGRIEQVSLYCILRRLGLILIVWPNGWWVMIPSEFPILLLSSGSKHSNSISVPFCVEFTVPLSVEELSPNSVPSVAMKAVCCTHRGAVVPADAFANVHSLLSFIPQRVDLLLPPVRVHLKVKVPPGQEEVSASRPVTSPGQKRYLYAY